MAPTSLQREIKRKEPFESPAQEALLNLLRTYGVLSAPFVRLFKQHGISDPQYNVLRILSGAGEELPCLEIAERMVSRVPDITRLIDRLAAANLVKRRRSRSDRRMVLVGITDEGRDLLSELDEPVRALRKQQLGHLSAEELTLLNQLLVKARTPH